jgi:hypothetical protein
MTSTSLIKYSLSPLIRIVTNKTQSGHNLSCVRFVTVRTSGDKLPGMTKIQVLKLLPLITSIPVFKELLAMTSFPVMMKFSIMTKLSVMKSYSVIGMIDSTMMTLCLN